MNFAFGGGAIVNHDNNNWATTDNSPMVFGSGGIHQGHVGTGGLTMGVGGGASGTNVGQSTSIGIEMPEFNPFSFGGGGGAAGAAKELDLHVLISCHKMMLSQVQELEWPKEPHQWVSKIFIFCQSPFPNRMMKFKNIEW